MAPEEKLKALKELGAKRRASIVPAGCFPIGAFHDEYYECEFVSPWTISAQNVSAKLVVVLQDWCGSSYLSQPVRPIVRHLGHDPNLLTNKNLIQILKELKIELHELFGTNAFPFVKSGAMNAKLEEAVLCDLIERFLLPQIQVVGPRVAVLLGKTVYNATREAMGFSKVSSLDEAIATPFQFGEVWMLASVHTGAKIHIHRGWERTLRNWRRVGEFLN